MSFFDGKNSGFYKEQTFLRPSDLVAWKRDRKIYNFESLPPLAIISIKKNVFLNLIPPFAKKIKGINGHHYNFKSKILFCSEFGSGAPAMLMLLEELKALGVKHFIFIGTAGILNDSIKENTACIISKVYSSSGSSFFYFKDEEIDCYAKEWYKEIGKKCHLRESVAWSTDCPFRETQNLINYYKSKSCDFVDMESAALYAFSQYYQTPSVCILVGSDQLTSERWKAPKNVELILKSQQNIVAQLVKF